MMKMQVTSKLVEIARISPLTSEYIESELTKRNISHLRWAVVSVSDTIIIVSVANLHE